MVQIPLCRSNQIPFSLLSVVPGYQSQMLMCTGISWEACYNSNSDFFLGWGLRSCVFNLFPRVADATGPWATLLSIQAVEKSYWLVQGNQGLSGLWDAYIDHPLEKAI